MSVIRAFIALDITPAIQNRLKEVSNKFKEQLADISIRWVPSENIHLTLKFLGDVSETNLHMLTDILKVEASHHPPFEISVGDSGAYPNNNRPRVLWVGVQAPPELDLLQSGVASEMEKLGYARERRSYSPHLTIGRVGRNVPRKDTLKISEVIESNKIGFLGATRIHEVCLYKSDLKPSGAVYTRLFTAPLQ